MGTRVRSPSTTKVRGAGTENPGPADRVVLEAPPKSLAMSLSRRERRVGGGFGFPGGGASTGQVGFFSVQLRKYCTWESGAPAGRSQVFRVIAWFSRTVTFSLTLSHVQSESFCTWEDFNDVERQNVSA